MNLVKINHQLPDLLISVCDVTTKMAETLRSYLGADQLISPPAGDHVTNLQMTGNQYLDAALMSTRVEDLPGFR